MSETKLEVDYNVVNAVNTQLSLLNSSPQEVYIAIGKLRQTFLQSNSDCANALIDALDEYEEVYRLILKLAENSVKLLSFAKVMYTDMDDIMRKEIENNSNA